MAQKSKNPQNYRTDRTDRLDRPTARPTEPTDGRRSANVVQLELSEHSHTQKAGLPCRDCCYRLWQKNSGNFFPTAVGRTEKFRMAGRKFSGRSENLSADGKKNGNFCGRRKIFRSVGRSQTTQNVMRIHSVQESSKSITMVSTFSDRYVFASSSIDGSTKILRFSKSAIVFATSA